MRLAVALLALLTSAAAWSEAPPCTFTAEVHTERVAESVTVRVWGTGPRVLEHPERSRQALAVAETASGDRWSVIVEDCRLPVYVELSAKGHVAVEYMIHHAGASNLPMAWLPAGRSVALVVQRDGKPVEGALVRGKLQVRGPWTGTGAVWSPVIPHSITDAEGRVTVVVEDGRLAATVLVVADDGDWLNHHVKSLPPQVTLDLASRSLMVRVTDERGWPVAGVRVSPVGAPEGTAVLTGDDGRAEVKVDDDWDLVAVAPDGRLGWRRGSGDGNETTVEVRPAKEATLVIEGEGGDQAVASYGLAGVTFEEPIENGRHIVPLVRSAATVWVLSPETLPMAAIAEQEGELAVHLYRRGRVDGRVVTTGGEPVAGAVVRAHVPHFVGFLHPQARHMQQRIEPAWSPWAVSDDDGRFELPFVPPGSLELEARVPEAPPARARNLEVEGGKQLAVTLTIPAASRLAVRLVNPEGAPIPGGEVEVRQQRSRGERAYSGVFIMPPEERSEPEAEGTADEEGYAVLELVPAGTFSVRLDAPGFVLRWIDDVEIPVEGADLRDQTLHPGVTVEGVTVDHRGRPVAHAEVGAGTQPQMPMFRAITTSDENGAFVLEDLAPSGEIFMQARAEGFVPRPPLPVPLPPDGKVELPMERERVLEGRVAEKASQQPVPDADVVLTQLTETASATSYGHTTTMPGQAKSDAEGRFRIGGLASGSFQLSVTAKGFRAAKQDVELEQGRDPGSIVVMLEEGLRLYGRVVDPDGAPAGGVSVVAYPATRRQGSFSVPSFKAVSGGTFTADGLDPGQYRLEVNDERGIGSEIAEAGQDSEVVIRLEATATILGRVVDPNGTGVAGARVMPRGPATHYIPPTQTDPDGSFRLEQVASGTWALTAGAEGYALTKKEITVAPGEEATVELRLQRGGTVMGIVRGLTAVDLDRCWVASRGASGVGVDADGRFILEGVSPGRQQILAIVRSTGQSRSAVAEVTVDGPAAEVEFIFGEGVSLEGTVTRAGVPAPGLPVAARSIATRLPTTTGTDPEGRYHLRDLEPGEYDVTVSSPTGNMLSGEVVVIEYDMELDLEVPGAVLEGRVVDEREQGVSGARVSVARLESPRVERTTVSGDDGLFRVDELPDGSYQAGATAAGHGGGESRLEVSGGIAPSLTIRLTDESAQALLVPQAARDSVWIRTLAAGHPGPSFSIVCDAEGRCPLNELVPGRYTALVLANAGSALVPVTCPGEDVPVQLAPTAQLLVVAEVDGGAHPRVRLSDRHGLVLPISSSGNPMGEWAPVPEAGLRVQLPPGEWTAELLHQGSGTPERRDVGVPAGGEAEVRF